MNFIMSHFSELVVMNSSSVDIEFGSAVAFFGALIVVFSLVSGFFVTKKYADRQIKIIGSLVAVFVVGVIVSFVVPLDEKLTYDWAITASDIGKSYSKSIEKEHEDCRSKASVQLTDTAPSKAHNDVYSSMLKDCDVTKGRKEDALKNSRRASLAVVAKA